MSELPNRELPRSDLAARYREVRAQSEQICAPLAVDDYQVQSVVDASPPKWHLAHVSWFFETFLLRPFSRAYEPFHPRFGHLFNSYYNAIGAFHPRPERHTLSRPTVEEIYRYRAHVNEHMLALIAGASGKAWPDIAERVVLGLNHEQQHQELLLMDIKRNFLANPLFPAYAEQTATPAARSTRHRWIECAGGLKEIGHEGEGFCFDNETPRHKVFLRDFWLGSRLITNGEYLEFIDDGGYARPELWLSDGWRSVGEQHWEAPLYWRKMESEWREMTLHGMGALDRGAPVCHVSYYEADAFARWREARLPMEAELEAALSESPIEGNFLESGFFHPRAVNGHGGQWFGDLWEWTTSAYSPYPGFKPMPGALGEYNGKFMANQLVLRGGSCATPKSHIRATYRNFFYPHDRWPFTGIRLARDGS